jgi:hypothetical protein
MVTTAGLVRRTAAATNDCRPREATRAGEAGGAATRPLAVAVAIEVLPDSREAGARPRPATNKGSSNRGARTEVNKRLGDMTANRS